MNPQPVNIKKLSGQLAAVQLSTPLSVLDKSIIESCVEQAMLKDRPRFRRWFTELLDKKNSQNKAEKLIRQLTQSLSLVAERDSYQLKCNFDSELPIAALIAEIDKLVRDNQVVIVAGETGSGKTTQLPKICLQLGRGVSGQIGHTQPRRLAARTVASRIAEELEVELGGVVGYQYRFTDQSSEKTRLKLMTDGILLSEIASDKLLLNYDTLIIDEAHERSLNIDFLLGYLKRILPKRPDLKIIITSATIDVERFAGYFNDAPVVEIEGRSYPVDLQYRDPGLDVDDAPAGYIESIARILEEIDAFNEAGREQARDVLVFLPGEREIRDVSQYLRKQSTRYDVLPLYARLTQSEQQKVFRQTRAVKRRVVLATNVAETSVTVPGIGYVIDTGVARVNRFSARSKLQRLQIEPVSQASARQRAGRCGRIAPGICFRLYSEDDFSGRPEFTQPEILRTNLASVILQMKGLGLGEIDQFPFIEPPTSQQINSGLKALVELGALNSRRELTAIGKQLARLPVDPAHGRMLLAARENNCLEEMLVIVSALAVQDPREFPADARQAAEQKHRRFWHPQSDFITWINLWVYYEEQREKLSQNRLRKLCHKEMLSYTRMREWRDLHRQLLQDLRQSGNRRENQGKRLLRDSEQLKSLELMNPDNLAGQVRSQQGTQKRAQSQVEPLATGSLCRSITASLYEKIHCSILMGLPLQIGNKFEVARSSKAGLGAKKPKGGFEYRSVSSKKFFIFPGSSQFKKTPRWVVAGEITETRKVFARNVAQIEPHWILRNLPHLLKFQYGEPYWESKRGQVMARRSSSLYGLPIVSDEPVYFEKIDAQQSRACFIREALVNQALEPDKKLLLLAPFWQSNKRTLSELSELEERLRKRSYMPDENRLYAFYDKSLSSSVCSRASLYHWLKKLEDAERRRSNDTLTLNKDDWIESAVWGRAQEQFPGSMTIAGREIELSYQFQPGHAADGVTARIPLDMMPSLPLYRFEWLVPGILGEKVIEMLRLLPKQQRKQLVPLPACAEKLLSSLDTDALAKANTPLVHALVEKIAVYYSTQIDAEQWQRDCDEKLDSYYRMHFEIEGGSGKPLREGSNISLLQREMQQQVEQKIDQADTSGIEKQGITSWDFGALDPREAVIVNDSGISAFPALLDRLDSVSLVLLGNKAEAIALSRDGVLRLALLRSREQTRYLKKQFKTVTVPVLPYVAIGKHAELVDDMIKAAVAYCCFDDFSKGMPTSEAEFQDCLNQGAAEVVNKANEIEKLLHQTLKKYQQCCEALQKKRSLFPLQCEDIQQQLEQLLYPGFLHDTGFTQVQHLPRYLEAILVRFDRLGGNEKIDSENCEKLSSFRERLQNLLYKYPRAPFSDSNVFEFRWMMEELRVSLFAQRLKTPMPVSFKRLEKAWEKIDRTLYPLASFN